MNKSIIGFLLFRVLQFEGFFLLLPCIVALIYKDPTGLSFLITGVAAIIIGSIGSMFTPKSKVFYAREGFVTVALSWILLSLVGAVPFVLSGEIPSYIDAVFEIASGFTTTGASILTDVEALSMSAQFFRCFSNWIGGMGVLVFIMAVVPLSGSYNLHLMRAESTGAEVGKLVPRIKDTAKILYSIYFGITVALVISYLLAGMRLYDALIISFSTMGTGGFANLNASVGGYSYTVQTIATVFMFLCGINFTAYFYLLKRKPKDFFKNEEIRYYFFITLISACLITYQLKDAYPTIREAFHHSLFQVVSIMTTTGFATADFDKWPMFSKGILLFLMVVGGCAGSTAGGIKVSRLMLSIRSLRKEVGQMIHPRSVRKVRVNDHAVGGDVVRSVGAFITAYVALIIISTLIVCIDGFDFTSSFASVMATVNNVGPGFGMVGPTGNYSQFSALSKAVLSFDMLAGRLEIFPMLVLFNIHTWKKN